MRVMVVGSGHVGGELARWLRDSGADPVLCSRRPPTQRTEPLTGPDQGPRPDLPWHPLDATDRVGCADAVRALRPDAMVLVHGPSDVTWCESHPTEAAEAHTTATANLVAASPGTRLVLISTDNVFAGDSMANDETTPTHPINAYGRAKLQAEKILLERSPLATVLRVSLIYGWRQPGTNTWLNHFARCADLLRRGELVEVPDDHWNTPVLVDDVAQVTAALLDANTEPLLHLGGPDRISRYDWALKIADALGYPRGSVTPISQASSGYACRPVNACLTSVHLGQQRATRDIEIRGVNAGLTALTNQPPHWWTTG